MSLSTPIILRAVLIFGKFVHRCIVFLSIQLHMILRININFHFLNLSQSSHSTLTCIVDKAFLFFQLWHVLLVCFMVVFPDIGIQKLFKYEVFAHSKVFFFLEPYRPINFVSGSVCKSWTWTVVCWVSTFLACFWECEFVKWWFMWIQSFDIVINKLALSECLFIASLIYFCWDPSEGCVYFRFDVCGHSWRCNGIVIKTAFDSMRLMIWQHFLGADILSCLNLSCIRNYRVSKGAVCSVQFHVIFVLHSSGCVSREVSPFIPVVCLSTVPLISCLQLSAL
jgi:hypothetical protein